MPATVWNLIYSWLLRIAGTGLIETSQNKTMLLRSNRIVCVAVQAIADEQCGWPWSKKQQVQVLLCNYQVVRCWQGVLLRYPCLENQTIPAQLLQCKRPNNHLDVLWLYKKVDRGGRQKQLLTGYTGWDRQVLAHEAGVSAAVAACKACSWLKWLQTSWVAMWTHRASSLAKSMSPFWVSAKDLA